MVEPLPILRGGRVFYKDDAVTYFEHWRKLVPAFHLWA